MGGKIMRERRLRIEQIRAKLTEIEESVNLVLANLSPSFEEFSQLGLVKDGIYKRTEFAIENVIDICAIINSDLSLGMPESEESFIEGLVKRGVLTETMGDKVRTMKGFRNIVVHRYGKIDDRIAYSILKNHIYDFYEFIESIEGFLETT
jgi:uncharacterized protein YutE (UPF0331/DUF86 family)